MPPSKNDHEALLKSALALLDRWMRIEAREAETAADDEDISDQLRDLSEDVIIFIDMCRDLGVTHAT